MQKNINNEHNEGAENQCNIRRRCKKCGDIFYVAPGVDYEMCPLCQFEPQIAAQMAAIERWREEHPIVDEKDEE